MKLTTIILIASLMQVSAASFGQRLTLNQKNVTLDEVFREIRKQTGYDVLLINSKISTESRIDAAFNNTALDEVLDQLLEGRQLSYTIRDKTIVIKQKEPSLIDKLKSALNIAVTVSGKVTNELGEPLPGVTVRQKETTNATVTDAKGSYSISVPDNNTLIIFSFIGYETQELAVKDIPNGSVIRMKVAENNLKEVVINKGYYTERQELSTGNVSRVTAKEIGEQPVTDPILALEGRVPGLYISQTSGIPGSSSIIHLRGQNSIPNNVSKLSTVNDPLYIIDGVPFGSASLTSTFIGGGAAGTPNNVGLTGLGLGLSPFNNLNPNDIESIEVLKDADATAIYGSRGANGVILITTKKGSIGETKVNVDFSQGIGQVTRMLTMLNTQQYLQMRHEAFKNDGATPSVTDYDLNGTWDTTRNTNWQKLLIGNTANYTNAQASISGGNVNTQFLVGGNYSRQTTVFPGAYSDKKGSAFFNLTHSSANQRFRAQFSANYVNDSSTLPSTDLTGQITLAPDAPAIYDANGNLNWQMKNGTATWSNPLAYTVQNDKAITNNLFSSLNLSYELVPGLALKTNLGYTHSQLNQTNLTPASFYAPPNNTNPAQRANIMATNDLQTWIAEPQISYQRRIYKGVLNVLIGGTFQGNTSTSIAEGAAGFASDALITNPAAGSNFSIIGNQYTLYHYNAIYGRINYNWEEKYLVNITGRRDGSSRFGPGKQFGNFGAIGAGWIFTKEKFLQDASPVLSFGKLRASYGITGNDGIKDYQYLSTYNTISSTYQGLTGVMPSQLTNPDFAWEQVKKIEGGIELGFLKDRINLTTSYYRNRTTNQLVGYGLPLIAGFGSVQYNLPAIIDNTGLEFTINTINIKSPDFTWTSSANLSIPKNVLVAYPGIENSSYKYLYVVGQSLFTQQVYHFTGVDPQTGKYTFATSDPVNGPTAPQDWITSPPITQKYFGGLQNSLSYKGWQLDVFFQFVKQVGQSYAYSFYYPGAFNANQPVDVLQRWQKPGDVTNVQRFSQGDITTLIPWSNAKGGSDYTITDASFIRLKNLAVSYRLPTAWQKWARLRNARIYLQGQNLLTFTKYQGLDPETMGLALPPLRVITIGTQATF